MNIWTKSDESVELFEICYSATPNKSALRNNLLAVEPEPKKRKICKVKIIDVMSQLKELLSRIL